MSYEVTEEQEQLRLMLRELFGGRARPRDSFDGGPPLDREIWARLSELGLVGIFVPEEHGGSGGALFDQTLVAEEIGAFAVAVPVVTSSLAAFLLTRLATEEALAAVPAVTGAADPVLAAVSAARGFDLGLTAVEKNGGWRVSGSVDDLLEAAPASSLVLPADTAGGPAWFLVNVAGLGVALLDQPSLDRTQRLGALTLSSAPAGPLGADPGETLVAQASRLAWLLLAAQATGAAERALRLTVEYAGKRRAFGQPIGRFQAVKHRVAEMLLSVENARSAAYNAAWAQDSGRADVALASHMAKAVGTENAVSVIQTAIQMHGGIGYTWEYDLHLLLRRAKSCELVLGNPTVHFAAIANALLDPHLVKAGSVS